MALLAWISLVCLSVQWTLASPVQNIVGGEEARPPGSYPWQGYLERETLGTKSFICGSVLVDTNVAMTAAHCVEAGDASSYFVTFGAHDKDSEVEGMPMEFSVTSISIHPNWTNNGDLGFPNDVAVMILNQAIPEDNIFIQPIALPEPGRGPSDWVDQDCLISGWGRLRGGGQLPNLLQRAFIPVITSELCDERWSSIGYEVISDIHVCVWDEVNQDKGSCNGDSGGPLVCRSSDTDDYEFVGVTSWGLSGCSTAYPSVYARVSTFREWIDTELPLMN